MGNNGNNGKKKHTAFKNVMISLGCAIFAGAYVAAIVFVIHLFVGDGGYRMIPAWLNHVEIHVDGEKALTKGNQNSDAAGIMESDEAAEVYERPETAEADKKEGKPDKSSNGIGQEPRFIEEETEAETAEDTDTRKENDSQNKKEESALEEDKSSEDDYSSKDDKSSEEDKSSKDDYSSEDDNSSAEDNSSSDELSVERANDKVGSVELVQLDPESFSTALPDVTDIVKAVLPCVVAVRNEFTAYDYWYDMMVEDEANASGIIVAQNDEELMIVTNYHVIEGYNDLYIRFIDDEEVPAYVKGVSEQDDIAILSVFMEDLDEDTLDNIAIAVLGDSDKLEVGEATIAIGNALGYGQSVTTGIISAFSTALFDEEDHEYLIQTNAAINPGNSGGALLNAKGEVIGICEGKLADYVIEGMGYAIPISTIAPIMEELMQAETKKKVPSDEKGFLGISGTDVSEEGIEKYGMPEGVFISEILEDTAAEETGLLKGDIIISVDGERLVHMQELQNLLDYYAAGTEVEVVVMRQIDGEYIEKTFDVVLKSK